jgi:hypothetical protein
MIGKIKITSIDCDYHDNHDERGNPIGNRCGMPATKKSFGVMVDIHWRAMLTTTKWIKKL